MSYFLLVLGLTLVCSSLADINSYKLQCDAAFCKIYEESMSSINNFKKIVESGVCVSKFGQKADELCNSALERFSVEVPLLEDGDEYVTVYDKKIEDLERILDSPLHVIYLKQLQLLREKALKMFKSTVSSVSEGGNEFEAMIQADEMFRHEAEESTRHNPDWDYSRDLSFLKQSLGEVAAKAKKIQEVKSSSNKQTQQAMQYLQQQQQQLQAIQQQIQGSSSPWSAALAYRIPDSNLNLNFNYQQGRSNLQISCVPDEAVPLLGPNGFVNGVTPGNVGITINMNI